MGTDLSHMGRAIVAMEGKGAVCLSFEGLDWTVSSLQLRRDHIAAVKEIGYLSKQGTKANKKYYYMTTKDPLLIVGKDKLSKVLA